MHKINNSLILSILSECIRLSKLLLSERLNNITNSLLLSPDKPFWYATWKLSEGMIKKSFHNTSF